MNSDSDSELLARIAAGDRDAFAELVEQWQEPLLRVAYRIVGRVDEAEEIRQTVLLRVLESPQWLPEPGRFAAWIRRCAINEAIARARRRKVQAVAAADVAAMNELRREFTAPEKALHTEESDLLQRALAKLDADTRALLSLRFDEDMTFRQIAEVLDRPASTVKSQLTRAIEQLRKLLASPKSGGEHR